MRPGPNTKFFKNRAEICAYLGRSIDLVKNCIVDGRIRKTARGYFIAVPEEQVREKGPKQAPKTGLAKWEERKKRAEALHKELKLRQLKGELITLDSAIRVWQKAVVDARQILLALVNSLEILVPEGSMRHLIRQEATRYVNDALRLLEEGASLK